MDIKDLIQSLFDWCYVPRGYVTLLDASAAKPPGTRGGKFEVSPFQIAKYPVTNAHYRVFLEDRSGYSNVQWWDYSSGAHEWRAEHPQAVEAHFGVSDFPRTNVNWFDAIAFCLWLSEKTAQSITLPTEQQWQRAAQGDGNQLFPWGNRFDPKRCNFDSKSPTPVSLYASGQSPYHVMDMSGNVWEWCLTEWGSDSAGLSGASPRILRGGSWGATQVEHLHVNFRSANLPHIGLNTAGFRIARSV